MAVHLIRCHAGLPLDRRWRHARCLIEFVAGTCCVPLQPQGLCPVVVGRSTPRQDLDCLAEQLKCTLQIPSLCRGDTLQLQLFHLLQQLRVKAAVWRGEINRLKRHSNSIDRYRGKENTEMSPGNQLGLKCHVFFFLLCWCRNGMFSNIFECAVKW